MKALGCAVVAASLVCATDARAADTDREARDARARAWEEVEAMANASSQALTLLVQARARRDAAQITCVDHALSRVDSAYRYGRLNAAQAESAYRDGDVSAARHEMLMLSRRYEAARAAARDAWRCTAPVAYDWASVNATTVTVTIDPSLPRDVADYPKR